MQNNGCRCLACCCFSCVPRYILRGQMASDAKVNVVWSYDVKWVPSPVQWASRWDNYLSNGNRYSSDEIHWFAIVNSVIIAVFLTVCGHAGRKE